MRNAIVSTAGRRGRRAPTLMKPNLAVSNGFDSQGDVGAFSVRRRFDFRVFAFQKLSLDQ